MMTNVVVGFDFSPGSRVALERAVALTGRRRLHVLHVLCVVERHRSLAGLLHHGRPDLEYCERVQAAVNEVVTDELRRTALLEHMQFCVHVRIGHAVDEILDLAREVGADRIILGKREADGVRRLLLGSVAEHVVRHAGCSVEIARAKTYPYVERYAMSEVEPAKHHELPHRYEYETGVLMRPDDWPLY
jgi:nucleotide-binding universal stress UspA family protein